MALNIYYDDEKYDDPDHDHQELDNIFIAILNILEQNNVLPLPSADKSKLLEYVRDNIIEYYKNHIYNQTIIMMQELFETYNKYIINESKYLDILEKILEKMLVKPNKSNKSLCKS